MMDNLPQPCPTPEPSRSLGPTLDEMVTCVRRELAMRKRAYPKWILQERMTAVTADREIACMEAVLKNLEHQQNPPLMLGL